MLDRARDAYDDLVPMTATAAAFSSVFGGGVSIFNVETGRTYRLQGVGHMVWEELATPVPMVRIRAAVARAYGITDEMAARKITALVASLREAGLVEVSC